MCPAMCITCIKSAGMSYLRYKKMQHAYRIPFKETDAETTADIYRLEQCTRYCNFQPISAKETDAEITADIYRLEEWTCYSNFQPISVKEMDAETTADIG